MSYYAFLSLLKNENLLDREYFCNLYLENNTSDLAYMECIGTQNTFMLGRCIIYDLIVVHNI